MGSFHVALVGTSNEEWGLDPQEPFKFRLTSQTFTTRLHLCTCRLGWIPFFLRSPVYFKFPEPARKWPPLLTCKPENSINKTLGQDFKGFYMRWLCRVSVSSLNLSDHVWFCVHVGQMGCCSKNLGNKPIFPMLCCYKENRVLMNLKQIYCRRNENIH